MDFLTPQQYVGGFASSHTFSYTCSGSDTLLLVGIGSGSNNDIITGVTYGGVAMTRAVRTNNGGPSAYWYYLVNPPAGANNVVISQSAAGGINVMAVCLFDAPQSSVIAATGGNGNSFAASPYSNAIATPGGGSAFGLIHSASTASDDLTPNGTPLIQFEGNAARFEACFLNAASSISWAWASGIKNVVTAIIAIPASVGAVPVITGPTGAAGAASISVNVAENQSTIGTWTATNGGTWSISGGADAARVAMNGSGVVTFVGGGKNFEAPDDADTNGTYLFTVQNAGAGGTVTQDVTVTLTDVNEPPGAPTIGTATAGNASATVAFTPPAANGGPTPTSYTATSSPGGITGTGASSPIAVSGLTNDVEYTFSVTATNSEGTGPASAASNPVTPAAVTYSITSPAGGFAPNTGSGARAAGENFDYWAFANKRIGQSLVGATIQSGSGTLTGTPGRATIPGLPLSGTWEVQLFFPDDTPDADGERGTARFTGTAA